MAFTETQLSEMGDARKRVEAILTDDAVSSFDPFQLPPYLEADVRRRLDHARAPKSRAIALLTALDWLSVNAPCQALGAAFALQSFWAVLDGTAGAEDPEDRILGGMVALILQNVCFALNAAGAFEETIRLAADFAPHLQRHRMPLTLRMLHVAAAEAALELGRPRIARERLPGRSDILEAAADEKTAQALLGATLVRRDNIALRLSRLETAAIAESPPVRDSNVIVLDETIEAVRSLLERSGSDREEIERATGKLETLRAATAGPRDQAITQAIDLIAAVEEILAPLAPGLESRAARPRVATQGLASSDEGDCDAALLEIGRLKQDADSAKDLDAWLSHAWLESLVLEHHGRLPAALAALEDINGRRRTLIEAAASAAERAGLASAFADLAARTAMIRLRLGAGPEAAFEAIEAGKGRWLSDGLEREVPTLHDFRAGLAGERVHYLTYAVGSDATVAVFVPAEGEASAAEIPIGRDDIARVAEAMVHNAAFRASLSENLADRLGLLTSWIPAPSAEGSVRPGDVLIFAPHGPLHSIPLHALPAGDGLPLAPRLAVVRTHGAVLVAQAAGSPRARPSAALTLCALARNEPQAARRFAAFQSVTEEVARWLPAETLSGVAVDFEGLCAALRPAQAIHLFAHGDATANAPFTRSGLLFASGGQLPERGWDAFQTDHLVSPERIHGANLTGALAGSHITLQACVSGHAQSNLSGDAIGLEWSLLLSGAASVLAAHWHLDFASSTEFCRRFYGLWLGERLSRAEAWRRAAEAISETEGAHAWAAFSLTGDWR